MKGFFESMVKKIVVLCLVCSLLILFTSPYALAKDSTKPSVTKFDVNPSSITDGDTATITYSVKDSGGSGLKQVELWRSKDDKNHWKEVKKDSISGTKNSASGSFSDKPSPDGKYYYGIHVVDNAGNWDSEGGAKSVTVKPLDKTKPVVSSFSVAPTSVSLGGSVSIIYTVSDAGGSGLKQVELWRANDSGGSPSGWAQISTPRTLSGNGPAAGSFTNTPTAGGTYWYGIHVVDNAGNWAPEPSSRKVTVAAATDKASWVKDTIPDNTPITGGSTFNKTWTIKNTGTSTWSSSYMLKYVSNTAGRLSSISEVKISGTVSPGNTYTFTVPMKAPAAQTSEKAYREDWKFTNPSGSTIAVGSSSTIWALIKVSGNNEPGPFPAVDWNSSAYRSANLFWNELFAPQIFYSDGRISKLGSAKGNCTWYAHGRLRQLGYTVNLNVMTGNAYTWSTSARNAGITVNTIPTAGAVAQSTANRSIYGKYGHVAVVEKVNADGTLLISESSYAPGTTWDFLYRTRTVNKAEFNNYIHVTK